MKRNLTNILALAALAIGTRVASAGQLSLGDAAPPIKVGGWAKGVPVTGFEPGKIYVIEFWATWCGPCKVSIPHLTELRKKYMASVTFAGVSVWEKGDDTVTQVKKYVANEGDKMYYKVAFDTKDGVMAKSWLDASGQQGVPIAFVIQDRKVMWIGDPMSGLDDALSHVVAGTYDLDKAKADAAAKLAAISKAADSDEAAAHQAFDQAMLTKDYAKGLAILDAYLAKHPENESQLAETKVRALLMLDKAKALAYADAQGAKMPAVFVDVAVMLLHDNGPSKADPKVAETYAKKADDAFKGNQPYVKVILAQAYKVNGETEAAETTFNAAIDLAKAQGAPQDALDQMTKLYQETK